MRDKLMYRNLNKMNVFLFVLLLSSALSYAQKTPKPKEPAVACNGTADNLCEQAIRCRSTTASVPAEPSLSGQLACRV